MTIFPIPLNPPLVFKSCFPKLDQQPTGDEEAAASKRGPPFRN